MIVPFGLLLAAVVLFAIAVALAKLGDYERRWLDDGLRIAELSRHNEALSVEVVRLRQTLAEHTAEDAVD